MYLLLSILLSLNLFGESIIATDSSFTKTVQKEFLKRLKIADVPSLPTEGVLIVKKGWNLFTAPGEGIDIVETFEDATSVRAVFTYDFTSDYWVGFTLYQQELAHLDKMLLLRSLEPQKPFFVLSSKDANITIHSIETTPPCKEKMQNHAYLIDSGTTNDANSSAKNGISLASRYVAHFHRCCYDDTRVALIYTPQKHLKKKYRKYGPAEPYSMLYYNRSYENKEFYMFDYFTKKCYRGIFPSMSVPPSPVLQEISVKKRQEKPPRRR